MDRTRLLMNPRTVFTLPEGYTQALHFRVTEQRYFWWLNLAAIGLMILWVLVFGGWLTVYHLFGAPWVIASLPQNFPTPIGLLIVLGTLPLHEWIHGLGMRYFGHRPRYGIKPLRGVLYATADGALFWRRQYILIALAPFVVISAVMLGFSLIFPAAAALWFMFAASINATGAVGDFWMSRKALRFPARALFQDEADGMRVFIPTSPSNTGGGID